MRQFYTVILDRMTEVKGTLASEPYECGWAGEALAFVRIHSLENGQTVRGKIQVSVDGITWLDEGTDFKDMKKAGDYFVKVREFGGWLRLVLEGVEDTSYKVTTSLVLKE
mgnify:CR=1 FL=1